jgi:hypothetical protein
MQNIKLEVLSHVDNGYSSNVYFKWSIVFKFMLGVSLFALEGFILGLRKLLGPETSILRNWGLWLAWKHV